MNIHPDDAGSSQVEAAAFLGVKVETLAAWRSQGRGPRYIKVGRSITYPSVFLKEYLAAQTVTPEPARVRREGRALAAEAGASG
jgi:Helix-turn-helix domain